MLWAAAVLGIHAGAASALTAIAGVLTCVLAAALLARSQGTRDALLAHLGLLVLGAMLLVPALHREDATREALTDAVESGARVEVLARASADARPREGGAAWQAGGHAVMVRTQPGPARVGTRTLDLPAGSRMLATGGPGSVLGAVRAGATVRLRGTVAASGGLLILRVDRAQLVENPEGPAAELRAASRTLTAALPADEAAMARGMTTGDTNGMSEHTLEIMRQAGISHLVAVSGSNLWLVLGAVMAPCLLLGVRRRSRIALGALAAGGYVVLVGPEPSVLRAATMAAPILAARFVGVRASPLAALCAAAAVWSALDPATSASIGFLLSALATAAILILAPLLAQALHAASGGRIPTAWWLVITVPLAAQLACAPVLVLLSPEVSLWSVPVNILVAPIVGPATVIGMLALLLGPFFPGLASVLWQLCAGGAHLVIALATAAQGLPGAHLAVPEGAAGCMAMIGVLVVVLCCARWQHLAIVRWSLAAALVVLLAPPLFARGPTGAAAQWRIAACAVGQGDAVLLRASTTILIDTGPDPAALTQCLDRLGVEQIDLLVLTHPHADHVGGRDALTGERAPRAQWICPLETAPAQSLPAPAAQPVSTGARWSGGGLSLEVLWPPSAEAARSADARESGGGEDDGANDCSLVIAAAWEDGTTYVGLGDLEPVAQGELAALPLPRATVLKAAHHGSRRQDPGLYARLQPRLVLFTVGADNSFGHPAQETVDLATRLGASSARTDRDGTIVLPASDVLSPRSVGPGR
nr:ComEC/Rec2 family competence protein [Brachybacterium equifaecis]